MNYSRFSRVALVAIAGLWASACVNPYALRVSKLNYDEPQQAGSIQFTDPKLYRREALINERNEEVVYLNTLIEGSKSYVFKSEISREMETITAISAGLGLKFDPAAAKAYERDSEATDVQQEIRNLRLQMELEQLKRNVELLRAGLPTQTAGNDEQLGDNSNSPLTSPSSAGLQPDAAQLNAAITSITNLQTALAARLGASAPSPRGVADDTVNPIDAFRDRAAYRSQLNSARNAASLDELHDDDGGALMRLSFAATVLPPPKALSDSLGLLRMEVQAPDWSPKDVDRLYRQWLSHVNRNLNTPSIQDGKLVFTENRQLSSAGDLMDIVYFHYPYRKDDDCEGLSVSAQSSDVAKCGTLVVAIPRPGVTVLGGSGPMAGGSRHGAAALYEELAGPTPNFRSIFAAGTGAARLPANVSCAAGQVQVASTLVPSASMPLTDILGSASYAYFLSDSLAEADLQAKRTLQESNGFEPPPSAMIANLRPISSQADVLLDVFRNTAGRQGCSIPLAAFTQVYVPPRFAETVTRKDVRVAVYDVSPREQAQRLSTVARAADAISMAAAISGQDPGGGIGGSGSLGFSRMASGKADAIERAPQVVSFAEARPKGDDTNATFGWLLAPRVTMDATWNRLMLEQQLRPYDLSVDLVAPGWWPYLYLKTETAWAPDWRSGKGRTVADGLPSKTVRVNLSTNSADLSALTALITGSSAVRIPSIAKVSPNFISACADKTYLQITGQNIWRATVVVIGGRKFETLKLLPDMNGILVEVSKDPFPATITVNGKPTVVATVLTPYGPANVDIALLHVKSDGTCEAPKPPERGAPPLGDKPIIESIAPSTISICHPSPSFVILGKNLKGLQAVSLGAVAGGVAALPPNDGTLAGATFTNLQAAKTFAGMSKAELTIRTDKGMTSKEITLTVAPCPEK